MTPQDLLFSILKQAFSGKLTDQKEFECFADNQSFALDDAPFDIPNSWKWNYIGKVCDLYTGDSIAENVKKAKYEGLKEGFDYIGTKDISFNHTILYDNGVRIPFNNDFKRAYKDSLLMCIEGGSAGRKIAILDREVCFGNKLCAFNAKSINNKFLYFYLQSSLFKSIFADNLSGIIGGVSIKKIKNILLPIPPLEEQNRIVAKIEELLPLVDKYEEAWNKLEKLNKEFPISLERSILQYAIQGKLVEQRSQEGTGEELFEKIQVKKQLLIKQGKIKKDKSLPPIQENEIPFEIPSTWKWVRLGSICENMRDGVHFAPSYLSAGIPCYSAKDIVNNKINNSQCCYISIDDYNNLMKEKIGVKKNSLLITKSGSIGRSAIVEDYYEFGLVESIGVINSIICYPSYLKLVLDSLFFNCFDNQYTRGIGVKHLTLELLKKILIPLPPFEEQERIIAKIEQLLPLCRIIENE